MGSANEKCADRRRHNNRRASFDSKRAETRDHHWCVHGVNAAAASSSNSLVVNLYEFRPVFFICIRDYRSRQAIVLERNRNAKIEIVILNNLIVFENQPAERRMFFHRAND